MTLMQQTLDAALEQARDGDQGGYLVLWRNLSPAVCGYLRAKGATDPDATCNEVFLGAFRALGDFVGDVDQFRGLLFTIAQRRLADEFRRRARRPLEVPWSLELDQRCDPSAEHQVLASRGDGDAKDLLDALPADQRDVMMLRIFGDLTIEQIATALDKSPGAVKQLQRRGLDNLRRRVTTHPNSAGSAGSVGSATNETKGGAR
jgi:RNA polymerase sigma-70 factor (ECF subfamily)